MPSRTRKKPNLLVLGAAGGVANAFLSGFHHHRHLFGTLTLLDRKVLTPRQLAHFEGLDHRFVHRRLRLPHAPMEYAGLLKKYRISIVADLSTFATLPVLEATDRAGVSYLNTAINDPKKNVIDAVGDIYERRRTFTGAAHVLCSGMNPGAVNAFVRHGIARHGRPKEVVHFEIDGSRASAGWRPLMTWSREIFLHELAKEPGGSMAGSDEPRLLLPNALSHPQDMRPVLGPIMRLATYPKGYPIMHEENVTLSKRYGFASKFLYAIDPKTMAFLKERYRRAGRLSPDDLDVGDNASVPLRGSDTLGVMLDYGKKRVYYLNSMSNEGLVDTNATYAQVAIGVAAGLLTLSRGKVRKGAYFPEELHGLGYDDYIFSHMRVEEKVLRRKGAHWTLAGHSPMVRRKGH